VVRLQIFLCFHVFPSEADLYVTSSQARPYRTSDPLRNPPHRRLPLHCTLALSLTISPEAISLPSLSLQPESPRHLLNRGKIEEGRAALARMRGQGENSERVNAEMTDIQANIEFEKSLGKATYADCFKGNMLARTRTSFVPSFFEYGSSLTELYRRLVCGIFVQMFQQLTGVNFIFYCPLTNLRTPPRLSLIPSPYRRNPVLPTSRYQEALPYHRRHRYRQVSGLSLSSSCRSTHPSTLRSVCMTIPGIYMVERLGRRKFLIYGALWMSFCQREPFPRRCVRDASQADPAIPAKSLWESSLSPKLELRLPTTFSSLSLSCSLLGEHVLRVCDRHRWY
jgi:hypothetical protein